MQLSGYYNQSASNASAAVLSPSFLPGTIMCLRHQPKGLSKISYVLDDWPKPKCSSLQVVFKKDCRF